ncbi:recombinase family protein [Pluralibacter gergoviae]|nr:recombinase family protein [Pluralibacter gergoviae]
MPQLYSYIRWSSDRQATGTTMERQLSAARTFAAEHNLELVEIIESGVSAYRGKNRAGKLGDFIDAVRDGVIPNDSWLYCENLDRISRDQVDEATRLFLEIIGLGITIITGMDRKTYNRQSIRENPTDLMISILMFLRGNEESSTKSKRTTGNAATLIERHMNGLPVNIKSVGKHPFWIDDSGSQYESVKQHSVYWPIAREAIDLFLAGWGIYTVKRHLDEKYPNGLNGGEWDYQVLRRMRDNRALIGERTIKLGDDSYILKNYYPSLCKDETEFFQLSEKKRQNRYTGRSEAGKEVIKLLSGLKVLHCGHCGGTMTGFMNKKTVRYICNNGRHNQRGCRGWSITSRLVDHCTMIALLIGYIDRRRINSSDTGSLQNEVDNKLQLVDGLDKKISNITKAIAIVEDVSELALQLNSFNKERKELLLEIDRLRGQIASLQGKGGFEVDIMEFMQLIQWAVVSSDTDTDKHKIRKIVSDIVKSVTITKNNSKVTIDILLHGSDAVMKFRAGDSKPQWIFDTSDVYEPVDSNAVAVNTKLRESFGKLFNSAVDMLHEVGYPEIDGRLFWSMDGH